MTLSECDICPLHGEKEWLILRCLTLLLRARLKARYPSLLDMSIRGRSTSPRPLRDDDVEMDGSPPADSTAKVVVVTNLTRNVMESHLQAIFGFYGEVLKVDLPVYGKCKCKHAPTLSTIVAYTRRSRAK